MTGARSGLWVVAAGASLLLSLWCAYSDTVINPDGICYLLSAESFADSTLKQTLALCPQSDWPFYSFLIHLLSRVTPSTLVAANLINAVLSAISVLAFIAIINDLGGRGRVLWLAALTILLLHDFNGLRSAIIRDHGYWAAYLISIWFLLRYVKSSSWSNAIAWGLSLVIATLFRREGVFFLAFMPPGIMLLQPGPWRWRVLRLWQLNIVALLLAGLGAGYSLFHPQLLLKTVNYLGEVTTRGYTLLTTHYQLLYSTIKQQAMVNASTDDIAVVIGLMYVFWYLLNSLGVVTWIYAIVAIYGAYILKPVNKVLLLYLLINMGITFLFLLQHQFLSKRYVMAQALTLLLYVPFALDDLLHRAEAGIKQASLAAAVLLLVTATAVGGIFHFGYSKDYIHQAGNWMAANIPADANVYVNNYQLMFYSRHFGRDIFAKIHDYTHIETIADKRWQRFDYVALVLNRQNEARVNAIVNTITFPPLAVFKNKRGDYVAIYKV